MDLNTAKDYAISSVVVDEKGTDFDKCLVEMVNLLVDDFKFFASFFTKDRKGDYSKLFAKYSADTIKSVQEYLVNTYKEDLARLFNFSKNTSIKDFKEDRYLGSLDKGLTFNGIINDIVVIKRERGYHCKKIFKINLGEVISDIVRLFYTDTCFGKSLIENVPVYVSLSGKIVHDKDELMNLLERELVGSLLSRTPLKVVNYIKGSELLLSSTKDTQHDIQLPMFGKVFIISFERMAVKEVF